ncbi:fibroblast growth factor receptor substrate 3 isoform X2 [Tachyglossus aculeatus]|uniref:fibroblast growth factor receptor substrate 3 isoform X2 n=1 Tax=Tachyglossus aculeatus TaxID=9261 RepID=UPI0018F308DA|nr:fibroblast growth factor receptor substrate 3 isoform X2 [Tachyglossus aculeatus]
MGSCCSCLDKDGIPDDHPTKFKVSNVDDAGTELGTGVMELTRLELVLHMPGREAVRWPYLCLRRYGYDASLFSFESGRRCQTGQGIFAFKCSRAEEIFNLLQELMQCNSINVMEEPVIFPRTSHPTQLHLPLPRAPHAPSALGYTVHSCFPGGFPRLPGDGPPYSAPRPPSAGSLRHSSLGEESTHALIGPEEQSHTYINTPGGDEGAKSHLGVPMGAMLFSPLRPGAPLEERDPQVFLQPGQVKFVLGPTPPYRPVERCGSFCGVAPACPDPREPHPPYTNDDEDDDDDDDGDECPAGTGWAYENVAGPPGRGAGWRLSQEELSWAGSQRRAPVLHYENLPALPPVWERPALWPGPGAGEGWSPALNGCPPGAGGQDPLRNYVNTPCARDRAWERDAGLPSPCLPSPLPLSPCQPSPLPLSPRQPAPARVFSFDLRGAGPGQPRQLNYVQVELKGQGGDAPRASLQSPGAPWALGPAPAAPAPARRVDSYAVIDLKKTAAMSSLQRALPRDDGTARKTRHNSTDLPL